MERQFDNLAFILTPLPELDGKRSSEPFAWIVKADISDTALKEG